jgi:hypothetical protein
MVRFEDTPVRVAGRWLSLVGVIVVGVLLFAERRFTP